MADLSGQSLSFGRDSADLIEDHDRCDNVTLRSAQQREPPLPSDVAAVGVSRRERTRLSLRSGRTGLHGAPEALPMCLAVLGRYDEVQGLTDSLRDRIAERLLGTSAPEADHPVSIGEHDRFIVHASPRFIRRSILDIL